MNLSQQRREESIRKIREIREFIKHSAQDENAGRLLTYLSELEKEIKGKKYGLVFEEHREKIDETLENYLPVLTEQEDLYIDNGGQMNFLIEGDNLAALELLLKTHRGKIDLIYIDPPYNRGGTDDFIYDDKRISKTDAYIHSKWISFIKQRLELAKKLLTKNGAIFISIDDNEQANLKLLCDSIFDESNFAGMIPWRKRTAKTDVPFGISQDFEWILIYARSKFFNAFRKKENERKYYLTPDIPGRPWRIHDMSTQRTAAERPNSNFTIQNPRNGKEYPVNPNAVWRITKESFPQFLNENRIVFPGDYDFLKITRPQLRYFKDDDERKALEKSGSATGVSATSTLLPESVGRTENGTKDFGRLFEEKSFPFPKPVELIKYLIQIGNNYKSSPIILDFFAGSGTTGQAVLRLNAEDGGSRRFILCTNNENDICRNITYERIRRVIGNEGYAASLKYYKIDFVRISERLYYEYADELLLHIRELVELENGVNFRNNSEIAIVLTDEELDAFMENRSALKACRALYVGHDVLINGRQSAALKRRKITVNVIPQYYYEES